MSNFEQWAREQINNRVRCCVSDEPILLYCIPQAEKIMCQICYNEYKDKCKELKDGKHRD